MVLASAAFALLLAAQSAWARTGLLQQDGQSRSVELSLCETQHPDDALRSVHSELSAQQKLRRVKPRVPESFDIDTYFHFVVTNDTAHSYPPERIDKLASTQVGPTPRAPYPPTFVPRLAVLQLTVPLLSLQSSTPPTHLRA